MRALKHKLIWAALLTSLLLATASLRNIYRIHRENESIRQWIEQAEQNEMHNPGMPFEAIPDIGGSTETELARAVYLHRKKRYDDALETLSGIVGQGDARLQTRIRYNLGNLYLNRSLAEVEAGRTDKAVPLLTLAKQAYRQALALDSGFWDAKYNLELAMGLLPELDRISPDQPDDDAAKPSELWTTVPGFPRGLP